MISFVSLTLSSRWKCTFSAAYFLRSYSFVPNHSVSSAELVYTFLGLPQQTGRGEKSIRTHLWRRSAQPKKKEQQHQCPEHRNPVAVRTAKDCDTDELAHAILENGMARMMFRSIMTAIWTIFDLVVKGPGKTTTFTTHLPGRQRLLRATTSTRLTMMKDIWI
jgi:hypothetical protein